MVSVNFFSDGTIISLRCNSNNPAACISLSAFEMLSRVSHKIDARRSIFIDKIFRPCCSSHLKEMNFAIRPDMLLGVCAQIILFCFSALWLIKFKKLIVKMLCFINSLKRNFFSIFKIVQHPFAMYSLLYSVLYPNIE